MSQSIESWDCNQGAHEACDGWGAGGRMDQLVECPCACHKRRCPECGGDNINATETVCLACSNRAWSDR